jgi:hypothetical protein
VVAGSNPAFPTKRNKTWEVAQLVEHEKFKKLILLLTPWSSNGKTGPSGGPNIGSNPIHSTKVPLTSTREYKRLIQQTKTLNKHLKLKVWVRPPVCPYRGMGICCNGSTKKEKA